MSSWFGFKTKCTRVACHCDLVSKQSAFMFHVVVIWFQNKVHSCSMSLWFGFKTKCTHVPCCCDLVSKQSAHMLHVTVIWFQNKCHTTLPCTISWYSARLWPPNFIALLFLFIGSGIGCNAALLAQCRVFLFVCFGVVVLYTHTHKHTHTLWVDLKCFSEFYLSVQFMIF